MPGLKIVKVGGGGRTVGVGRVATEVNGLNEGILTIPSTSWTELVRSYLIANTPIAANEFGLFNIKGDIKHDKFKIASLATARHLWSSRKDQCQFNPKGKVMSNATEFTLDPIVYDGVQCPDEFFGTSWEVLFGTSNPMDMLKSPGGMELINEILDIILIGLQNDFWNLVSHGSNPIIATAAASKSYLNYVSQQEWDAFVDQMDEVGGFVTTADYLKSMGEPNFNVAIAGGDVSGDAFIGNAVNLLKAVKNAQPALMKTAANSMQFGKQVYLVTRGIFNKLKDEMATTFSHLEIAYQLFKTGKTGESLMGSDAIMWDGNIVVAFDQPAVIDSIIGYNTHMVLCTVPKNIPILYNANTGKLGDFGLVMQQTGLIKDKGQVFMNANMKVGTGFVNKNFVSYAVRRDPKA